MEFLYVIVPYFNFLNSKNTNLNLNFFVSNFKKYKKVKIVLVEGIYNHKNQLRNFSDEVYKHIKVNLTDILWVKENLINIGFNSISDEWEYGCWIDRDVVFTNPFWVGNSIEKLKYCDVLQPWVECLFLDEKYEKQKIEKSIMTGKILSYCYSTLAEKKLFKTEINSDEFSSIIKTNYFKHSGQAWCINRKFYNTLGKIYDKGILGGFDGFLCSCLNKQNDYFYFKNIIDLEREDYISKIKNAKIDYVNGLILHNYHGKMENRNYNTRYDIFKKNKLDVNLHLTYDENKILKFTQEGKIFKSDIEKYFITRKE
jgi:hypothetical protein